MCTDMHWTCAQGTVRKLSAEAGHTSTTTPVPVRWACSVGDAEVSLQIGSKFDMPLRVERVLVEVCRAIPFERRVAAQQDVPGSPAPLGQSPTGMSSARV